MQSTPPRNWTEVVVSISYDDNHYTTGTSNYLSDIPRRQNMAQGFFMVGGLA